jgi:hypothetical protein
MFALAPVLEEVIERPFLIVVVAVATFSRALPKSVTRSLVVSRLDIRKAPLCVEEGDIIGEVGVSGMRRGDLGAALLGQIGSPFILILRSCDPGSRISGEGTSDTH